MHSSKPFRIHLYKLDVGNTSLPLSDLLEQVFNSKLEDRERKFGMQPYRLEDATPPTDTQPCWLLDFSKRRDEGGPGKSSKKTPVESFEMGDEFGFAEETAALYDPASGFVVLQYNHNGPRATAIAEYLSCYDQAQPNHYDFLLQLEPNAQARLQGKTKFTHLKIKIAPAKLSNAFRENNVSLVEALSSQNREFGGDTVSIEVALNRGSNGSLKILNKLKALISMANDETDAVSAMVISGRDSTSPIDAVDLIKERLETTIKEMPLDEGRRYPQADRFNALQRAYNGWKTNKIIS